MDKMKKVVWEFAKTKPATTAWICVGILLIILYVQ